MKKQIFILVFLVVATFASVSKSFGQAVPGSAPKTITCTGTPLAPIAGVPYDYSATFAPVGGTAFWYATRSLNLGAGATRVATIETTAGTVVSAVTNYNSDVSLTEGSATSTIVWNSLVTSTVTAAAPLLVVVEYKDGTGSCANNMKVFSIVPMNAFTVGIRSMPSDGIYPGGVPTAYGAKTTQCVADILSAVYNPLTSSMNMDYGVQTLYFEVIVANFNASFTPSFKLTGLAAGKTAEIFWGATAATATTSLGAATEGATVTGTSVTTATADTKDGVSIFVKVVVNNLKVESTTTETISLAVDAKDASGTDDVDGTCAANAAFADIAEQDITMRPTITPTAPLVAVVAN